MNSQPGRGHIPQSFVEEICENSNIVEIVSRGVQLKKAGANYSGLCPFHSEASPSFIVSPTRGTYHCFGCGAHGNAIGFLIEHEGYQFVDAVEELARQQGRQVPREAPHPSHHQPMRSPGQASPKHPEAAKQMHSPRSETPQAVGPGHPAPPEEPQHVEHVDRNALFDTMLTAAKAYKRALKMSPEAISYLKERGFASDVFKRFIIGYSGSDWQFLKQAFPDYEQNHNLMSCGLVKASEETQSKSARRYDLFRDRIMFAVRDTRGRIVAFGGRVRDNSKPKYINSPETPIFDKSSTLFGLYEGRKEIVATKFALVVEGYIDVTMLAQHGIGNAVASMGTSLTERQLAKLLACTKEVVFAFDGDAAGIKAARRAADMVMPVIEDEHIIRFLILPDALDPDEYVRKHGAKNFEQLARQSPTLSEWLLKDLREQNNNLLRAEDRARFMTEATSKIRSMRKHLNLRTILLDMASDLAQLPRQARWRAPARGQGPDGKQAYKPPAPGKPSTDGPQTLWGHIAQAAHSCPQQAAEQLPLLRPLLDPNDADELHCLAALERAAEWATDYSIDQSSTIWITARDLLINAKDLISEHRKEAHERALLSALSSGQISHEQYLQGLSGEDVLQDQVDTPQKMDADTMPQATDSGSISGDPFGDLYHASQDDGATHELIEPDQWP